jgi:hypothetical protein
VRRWGFAVKPANPIQSIIGLAEASFLSAAAVDVGVRSKVGQ